LPDQRTGPPYSKTKCKQCLQSEKYYWNYATPMPLLHRRFQTDLPVLSTYKSSS
jgi:hypothetical protein